MKVTKRSLFSFIEQLNRMGSLVSQCCLILLLVLVFHEVIARYLFNSPTLYSVELSEYLLILLAFIAAGWVLQEDKHVRMQSFIHLLPEKAQHFLACLTSFIVLLFCGVLTWYGSKAAYIAWRGAYHSSSLLNMPMWIPYLIIPLGSLLLALQLLVHISTHLDKFLSRDSR
ncbi:MAG TPA: TRAP transporter small permease [Desulfobulbus sp.]|nr:TRAP transporter small permease [Desulfobulbus sp.]